ncbi:MAG: hypothetical protein JWM53_4434, partial [bacterium]|nr:hypothetical protein [bacterium]
MAGSNATLTPPDNPTRFEKKTFGVLLAVAGAFFL